MNQPRSEFQVALHNALDDFEGGIAGTIDEADLTAQLGATSVEHIVEASDLAGSQQTEAYLVLCDLMATRLAAGVDQILGCIVFANEPVPESLAPALTAMKRTEGFTPVLPIDRAQASTLATSDADVDAFVTKATLLIDLAADRPGPDTEAAATLLTELAELIDGHLGPN